MNVEQLWEYGWPSGADKPAGALHATPAELSAKFKLEFRRGLDDLDAYSQVGLRLPSGRVVQLLRYDAYPDAGTLMFVDREDNADDARRELLSVFSESPDVWAWTE